MSLFSSFNQADALSVGAWKQELENRILASRFIWKLEEGAYYKEALKIFGAHGIGEAIYEMLMQDAGEADFSLKIRIYYALAQYMKERRLSFEGKGYDSLEALCFGTIQNTIYENAVRKLPSSVDYRICEDVVDIALPVRVNMGGGWTDLSDSDPGKTSGCAACGIRQHGYRGGRKRGKRGRDPGLP